MSVCLFSVCLSVCLPVCLHGDALGKAEGDWDSQATKAKTEEDFRKKNCSEWWLQEESSTSVRKLGSSDDCVINQRVIGTLLIF